MIVYVDQAGKSPEHYTGGWEDRENKIPADPNSLFKIASISKFLKSASGLRKKPKKHLN
jgi:CubicO group peptidase (beta-lactamase class C family)